MFTINAYNNPYLRVDQQTTQALLSVGLDSPSGLAPAPLTLAIALDRSGSMEGERMSAARDGAIKVVQAVDETMNFLLVTFDNYARIIFGPQPGTPENKRRAVQALQAVSSGGGTCMSTALNAVVDRLGQDRTRATKILFLTDGKNEGEKRPVLNEAVPRCAAGHIHVNAWGVGTDWDAAELRHIADATHGTADIIPTPPHGATAVRNSVNYVPQKALMTPPLSPFS